MIHHVHGARTVLASALLVLAATVYPVYGGTSPYEVWNNPGFQAAAAPEVNSPATAPASITDFAATGETFQAAAMPITITPSAPTPTTNGLLTFTSQAEFETAFPGLPKEDFEESPVAAGAFTFCTGPINSSTNQPPNCFVPGDILPGLSIDSDPGHQLPVNGVGFDALTTSSVNLASNPEPDIMSISFSGSGVHAVGMDLAAFVAGGTYTINVFGSGNVLLDTITSPVVSTAETFFGVYSSQNIIKITLDNGANEVVDNIQFGGSASTVTFYTSQGAFIAAHPGLPVEDFEESPIGDTEGFPITGPIDSTSNIPGIFSPGDILDGLRINGLTGTAMAIIGGNFGPFGNTTKVVAENSGGGADGLRLDFTNNSAYAVGMDLMRAASAGNVTIAVYGPHGIFLGTTTNTIQLSETFVGVFSNQPITRIEILNPADFDLIDNIRFGGSLAGLTFFDNQAAFLMARPGLPVEDFEESTATFPTGCDEPINSAATLPGCFVPGDILPGISFQTVEKDRICAGGSCPMAVVPSGSFVGVTSDMIGPNNFVQNLEIMFAKKNVRYFGTDAVVILGGPADMLFSVYDDHDNFLGSALRNIGTTPVFFGVVASKHISRITVTNPGPATEVVDNVRFGAFPWQSIIPAISGH